MAIPVWGNLEKSQTNSEKIEEAVARLIAEHNESEEAHLGPGQSLQSHKASAIIDHVVESVVSDKIHRFAVTLDKFAGNKNFIFTNFESLDGWEKGGVGSPVQTCVLGGTKLVTSVANNDTCYIKAVPANGFGDNVNFDKNPVMQVLCKVMDFGYAETHIHIGYSGFQTSGVDYIGFRIYNNTIKAVCRKYDGSETAVNVTGSFNAEDPHIYRVAYESFESVKFYIDETLVATITTNIPTGDNEIAAVFIGVKNSQDGGEQTIGVYHALFEQE